MSVTDPAATAAGPAAITASDPADTRLLDPRGLLQLARLALAARVTPAELGHRPLLFYDNTKMDVGHYGLLLPRIQAGLARHGVTRFERVRETIRGKGPADIVTLARRLASHDVAGAVIALADMGVSPAMVALAVALERLGLPTVLLSAGPGTQLCVAHAHYRAGALCIVPFDLYHASDAASVTAAADASVPRILAMLVSNDAALAELARIDYGLDDTPAAADGYLPVACGGADASFDSLQESLAQLHIGDGLPIVPPVPARYERMRTWCPFDPDEVIVADIGPSGTPLRVHDALVAAVMAGCRPEYMPILLTALRALARPQYGLLQAVTTSFGGGHFVLASGPLARAVGLHGGQGCLGPGFRANATIGRAVHLVLQNVCRAVPGHADLACLSSPAEFSYCMAEDARLTPWATLNAERGGVDQTWVMTLKAEPPHAVLDLVSTTAPRLLDTIIDCCTTLGSNNAYVAGSLVLVLNPDHARLLVAGGYDKERLRRAIHAAARLPRALLTQRGLVGIAAQDDGGFHHVTRSPDDVRIVVAGGPGGHSAMILPWGLNSEAVFEPVCLPDGRPAVSLDDFLWR